MRASREWDDAWSNCPRNRLVCVPHVMPVAYVARTIFTRMRCDVRDVSDLRNVGTAVSSLFMYVYMFPSLSLTYHAELHACMRHIC